MTFSRLLLRNLSYHWRGNLAVLAGVALGTAVLVGALLVGDSLRGSLRALTLEQLGWVDVALAPGRFFRDELGSKLPAERASSVLLLTGTASTLGSDPLTAAGTNLLGIDAQFGIEGGEFWNSNQAEVAFNGSLAHSLGLKAGDRVRFFVHKEEDIPRETLLGRRKSEEVVQAIEAKIRVVLPDEGMARFALRPGPEPARNAFFPRRFLQEKLDLAGKANLILLGKPAETLDAKLHQAMTLEDWGLSLRTPAQRAQPFFRHLDPRSKGDELKKLRWQGRIPPKLHERIGNDNLLHRKDVVAFYERERNYLSLESQKMFIDPPVVSAVMQAEGKQAARTFIYLADRIAAGKGEAPYAVIAASDLQGMPGSLKNDDIALASYEGTPWKDAKPGEKVVVDYYVPDERNHLAKQSAKFVLKETYPLEGMLDDPDWTPEFRGITDKLSMSDWENPPFPYDAKRVKNEDEKFWERHRTTPRAFIALPRAQELWGSRFGKVTAIRLTGDAKQISSNLLAKLDPAEGGFVFQKVKEQGLRAGSGSTDFGVLFLSFSFFLIVASLLLVGLLVRLNLDRRGKEIGLLLATGWTPGAVRRLLLGEGILLTLLGALIGLGAARLYASAMLRLLALSWPEGAGLSFLKLHATPLSQVIGWASAIVVGVGTMWWANRVLSKLQPRALLMGESTGDAEGGVAGAGAKSWWTMIVSALGAIACVVAGMFAQGHEAKAGSFFGSGFLLLVAFLAFAWRRLKATGRQSDPQPSLTRLGMRNAGRYPVRSILTAGLLASAAFLVVAVQAFHREAGKSFLAKEGGSGGFPLFAESNVPLFQDLNQPATWNDLDLNDEQQKLWARATFWPLRVQPGDDASCLNLYQPLKPRVVGLPKSLIHRGGFGPEVSPLLLLEKEDVDGIPCLVDGNTAQWILKVGVGDVIDVPDEQGQKAKVRVVGLLQESLFQSEVLVAERHFLKLFPRREGFQFLLIEAAPEDVDAVRKSVSSALAQQGWVVRPTLDRLQLYLAVENTYLGTFQILGALGLLLGAVGLAIVLVRGVWERRAELALLRALGFSGGKLSWLVLAENVFLLLLGLGAGCAAAILAVAPHFMGSGAEVLWLRLGLLLGGVLVVGLAAASLAVRASLRSPLLTALRRE
ncbi:MAG: ABC transporter permease [Gemmataceae bacterium]|nr:ABC transporter permease [Gemmataceae bacterium]